jgi:hypothetical protein
MSKKISRNDDVFDERSISKKIIERISIVPHIKVREIRYIALGKNI